MNKFNRDSCNETKPIDTESALGRTAQNLGSGLVITAFEHTQKILALSLMNAYPNIIIS